MTDQIVNSDVKADHDTAAQDKAQAQGTEEPTGKGDGKMVPKARLDEVIKQRKEAQEALESVAAELIEDIPEDMRDLVPDLSPSEKIKWIRNAQRRGIFGKPSEGIDTKRPGGKAPQDLEGLDPHTLRKMGYKNH